MSSGKREIFTWGENDVGIYSTNWGNKYTYELTPTQSIFNNITSTTTLSSYAYNYPLFIFAQNNEGIAEGYSLRKIYSCKIYDDNILVRDLVPCYRRSDNKIGMYDLVNDVFYTNSGSGTFSKGKNATSITLVASEGIKNEETVLLTESADTLLTESGDTLLGELKTIYIANKNIILDDILRNLVINDTNYYDKLQILQDGTIQVIRKIGVSQNETLYLLDKEKTIILEDKFTLPTKEKGLYYFVEELNNLDYYADFIIKNEYSDIYATEAYVKSGLELKVDTNKLISELNASADIIKLVGQRLIILMQNYSLDENGYMKALVGEIAGFLFEENKFSKIYNTIYNFTRQDFQILMGYLNDYNELGSGLQTLYDLVGDSSLNILDAVKMANIINGTVENTVTTSGNVAIRSDDSNNLIEITNNLNIPKTRFGVFSIYSYLLSAEIISLTDATTSDINGIILDKTKKQITVKNGSSETIILPTGIRTPTLTQTSMEADKKNFEKLENVLEEVLKTDIYKYNLKSQKDDEKKHIGFVIGDNYNYSHLVTAEDENGNEIGVEDYSMTSVLWQAFKEYIDKTDKKIKELQDYSMTSVLWQAFTDKKIKELQDEINRLKGEK